LSLIEGLKECLSNAFGAGGVLAGDDMTIDDNLGLHRRSELYPRRTRCMETHSPRFFCLGIFPSELHNPSLEQERDILDLAAQFLLSIGEAGYGTAAEETLSGSVLHANQCTEGHFLIG
jgi:hypothetical protein